MKSFFVCMLIRFDQYLIDTFNHSLFTECHYLLSMCYTLFWTLGMDEKYCFFVCFFVFADGLMVVRISLGELLNPGLKDKKKSCSNFQLWLGTLIFA